jgi:hypothetical protein
MKNVDRGWILRTSILKEKDERKTDETRNTMELS